MGTKAETNGIDGIFDFGVDGDDNGCVSLLGVPLFLSSGLRRLQQGRSIRNEAYTSEYCIGFSVL